MTTATKDPKVCRNLDWLTLRRVVAEARADLLLPRAAAISFFMIVLLSPSLLFILLIGKFFLHRDISIEQIARKAEFWMGNEAAQIFQLVSNAVSGWSVNPVSLFLGTVWVVFGAFTIHDNVRRALNHIAGFTPPKGVRAVLWHRLYALVSIIGFALWLLFALLVNAWFAAIHSATRSVRPVFHLWEAVDFMFFFLSSAVLFYAAYRYIPNGRIPWRTAWRSAFFAGLMFCLGREVLGIYFSQIAIVSPLGAAGALVAFPLWIYYSTVVFLFGAELIKVG